MKIVSANSEATVTLTTSVGIIATVAHFYRGEPLYIRGVGNNHIRVMKLRLSDKYDYFLGYTEHLKIPSKVAVVDLDRGDEVIVKTDRGSYTVKITDVIPIGRYYRYKFTPRVADDGDSGSPVYLRTDDGDVIVGYLTHVAAFTSIAPILDAITEEMKKFAKAKTQ